MGKRESNRPRIYLPHHFALVPLLAGNSASTARESFEYAANSSELAFTTFLLGQGLAPLWCELIERFDQHLPFSKRTRDTLQNARLTATANYLLQRHHMQLAGDLLNSKKIPHAIIKGAHAREVYYDTPPLRPASDIDILIKKEDRFVAIKALQSLGFRLQMRGQTVSHECSLVKSDTTIDLHWDIMRPGRTRRPVVDSLLDKKIDYGSHWGLDHSETLFLMLVHPVFTKYTTTQYASLVRLYDMAQLLTRQPASIEGSVQLLRQAGLCTAGWITVEWFSLITERSDLCALKSELAPGLVRRAYLGNWLENNLSNRLLNHPLLIQLGFTAPAHDTLKDAIRAVMAAVKCRLSASRELEIINRSTEQTCVEQATQES